MNTLIELICAKLLHSLASDCRRDYRSKSSRLEVSDRPDRSSRPLAKPNIQPNIS